MEEVDEGGGGVVEVVAVEDADEGCEGAVCSALCLGGQSKRARRGLQRRQVF